MWDKVVKESTPILILIDKMLKISVLFGISHPHMSYMTHPYICFVKQGAWMCSPSPC
jgi:hypothetical protein